MWTAVFEFLKALLPFLSSIKKNKAGDVIVRTAEVYDNMNHIADVSEDKIGRIHILYAHNGGFDLKTGKPSFVTCLHEVVREPFEPVKGQCQKLDLDGAYNLLLRQLYLDQVVDIDANSLEKGSLLDQIFKNEGIQRSRSYFLKHTKEAFWFITFSTQLPDYDFDAADIHFTLTQAVSAIKQRI
jgi:hypothetical protein